MKKLTHYLFVATLLLSVGMCLTSCDDCTYKKVNGKICWVRHTFSFGTTEYLLNADTLTFEDLGHHYGKDKDHAFFEDSMIVGADVTTFKSVADCYALDARHAYRGVTPIPGVDPQTFEVCNENLSEDVHDYYWKAHPFHVADKSEFKVFYDYGCEAYWARDSKYGYYIPYQGPVFRFPIVNYKDFEPIEYKTDDGIKLLSNDYATDEVYVYYQGRKVKGVDLETFKVIDLYWAQDKATYYLDGLPTDSVPPVKNKE